MAKKFYLSQNQEDYPITVVISRSCEYIFLMQGDRILTSLTASEIFLIKDELETERAYKGLVMVYLWRLVDDMEPSFEMALNNKGYVEDVTEKYAEQIRGISMLDQTEEMRQEFFDNAFRQVDYRLYVKQDDIKVGA